MECHLWMALYAARIFHNVPPRILTVVAKRLLNYLTHIFKNPRSERKEHPRSHLLVTDGLGFEAGGQIPKGRAEKDQAREGRRPPAGARAALGALQFACGTVCPLLAGTHARWVPDIKVAPTTAASISNYVVSSCTCLICTLQSRLLCAGLGARHGENRIFS